MFLSVFAAEMALGITQENVDACLKLQKESEFLLDDGFYRSYLLYVILTTVCHDYLKDCDLKAGDPLYDNVVSHLTELTRAMHGEMKGLDTEVMGKLLEKGKFIIAGDLFGDDKHELRPLNKPCIDKILSMIRVLLIVAGVVGEEKAMAVCDTIVKMLSGDTSKAAKTEDSDLNFDL